MDVLTYEEQDRLLEIVRQHEPALLAYDGVKAVALGSPYKAGQLDFDSLAILVFVAEKKPKSMLVSEQLLPSTLDGLPVDVIESNPVNQEDRYDPLLGGISIANTNRKPRFRGTLGMIVVERHSTRLLGLSNWHVLLNHDGKLNDPVVQPSSAPNTDTYRIGHVLAWDKALDCAVFELISVRNRPTQSILGIPGVVSDMVKPLLRTNVMKSGATTGLTYGRITGLSTNKIVVTISPNPNKPSPSGEISDNGDSGAVWVTDEDNPKAVALHYSGESDPTGKELAWARDISTIAEALGFDLAAIPIG